MIHVFSIDEDDWSLQFDLQILALTHLVPDDGPHEF